MSTEITIAVIGVVGTIFASICTLVGVIIINKRSNREAMNSLEKQQAVFEAIVTEKIDVLTEEVRKYNNVKFRTSELEKHQAVSVEKIGSLERKVELLERANQNGNR